ncbi:MAG TPA: T9SS type A sorting domain-containing protein [Lentimicrobium sp.]|nr:T9SS type A sorting domain-containing protein [Lentimicrobium sp.]
MIKNYMSVALFSIFFTITSMILPCAISAQEVITAWNFDQQNLTPSTGTGTAATTGGTIGSYATGNPILYAWSTTNYPAQGSNSGTAGVQFNVSTAGYTDIIINWESRNSNSAANRLRLQYTLNGTDWLNFEASDANATNFNDGSSVAFDAGRYTTNAADWFFRSADLSAISEVGQNPDFAFRLVTEFFDATSYGGTITDYTTDGSIRFENVIISGTAEVLPPSLTSLSIPQFISGNTPSNNRLPFAYSVTLNNLLPSATYRYINSAVVDSDSPTSMGSGAIIYVNSDGSFTRTPVGSFTNPGEYGTFTTDVNGSYTGWFMLEPSTNTRFTPGNQLFMRIILNDGNDGTTPSFYLTTTESSTVLSFSTGTTANDGTGIRALSMAGAGNFAFLYDNEDGTGRPLFGTSIETTGIDFTSLSYAAFFKDFVAGVDGAWGGIVPNINPNGVRRIEERSLTDGAIVSTITSTDGMWGTTNTANPSGGLDNILVINLVPNSQITVNPTSLSGFIYLFDNGPSESQSYTVSATELSGTGNIEIVSPEHFEISLDNVSWADALELPFAGGIITGQPVTVYTRLVAGLPSGLYNNESITHSGGGAPVVNVTCSGVVTTTGPELASETVPQYIQGVNSINNQRIPYAFYLSFDQLIPGSQYKYYNKVVLSTDPLTEDGAGNVIFVNQDGTFTRSETPSITDSYGTFTADETGRFSGWFITEPTGDVRFTPGNQLYMRVMLNDGIGGTDVAYRITSVNYTTVINFGTEGDPESGTGVRGISSCNSGNFIYLFDNESGSGRPLYSASIESTGIDYTDIGYVEFFTEEVAGINGSWAGIVPNILPSGILRIEERSIADGSLVYSWTSVDGLWGTTNTVNPTGGDLNELVIELAPPPVPEITATPAELTGFAYLEGNGPSESQPYQLSANNLEGTGNLTIAAPGHYEISFNDTTYADTLYVPFENGVVTDQPVTVYVRLKTDLQPGEYNETICHTGGGAEALYVYLIGHVEPLAVPGIAETTIPVYMEGMEGTNTTRVPFAFMVTFQYLQPDATYRFYNKAVLGTDDPQYTGVGNTIFVNSDGSFNRTTGNSLGTSGQYGEFVTDSTGKFTGWFMLEPTGNERFAPGNELYMRFMLNDGNEGNEIVHYFTSAEFVKVLMFETSYEPTQGTAIRGISDDAAGNFVFLYDDITESGRPLYGTSIETTGIDFALTGLYAPFFSDIVEGVNGSWGGIVPNINANGVQLIKTFTNQTCEIVNTYEMPGGVWGITDTRNPSGGVDELLVINLTDTPVQVIELSNTRIWSSGKTIDIKTELSCDYNFCLINMQGVEIANYRLSGSKTINVDVPSGIYIARILNEEGTCTTKLLIK